MVQEVGVPCSTAAAKTKVSALKPTTFIWANSVIFPPSAGQFVDSKWVNSIDLQNAGFCVNYAPFRGKIR
jgi:hypothetical protein